MKVKWDDIKVGDFFTANINMVTDTLLYQKISHKENSQDGYNAVLLNKGELCNLYTGPDSTFDKVEVEFQIRDL